MNWTDDRVLCDMYVIEQVVVSWDGLLVNLDRSDMGSVSNWWRILF